MRYRISSRAPIQGDSPSPAVRRPVRSDSARTRHDTRAHRAITILAILALFLVVWLLAALVVLTWGTPR